MSPAAQRGRVRMVEWIWRVVFWTEWMVLNWRWLLTLLAAGTGMACVLAARLDERRWR